MGKSKEDGPIGTLLALIIFVLALPIIVLASPFIMWGIVNKRQKRDALLSEWHERCGKDGKRVLLVYTDHPDWTEYIETILAPSLEPRVVLKKFGKLSDHEGDSSIESKLYRSILEPGSRKVRSRIPVALVIPRKGHISTVDLYRPFKKRKYGSDRLLVLAMRELNDTIDYCISSHSQIDYGKMLKR